MHQRIDMAKKRLNIAGFRNPSKMKDEEPPAPLQSPPPVADEPKQPGWWFAPVKDGLIF